MKKLIVIGILVVASNAFAFGGFGPGGGGGGSGASSLAELSDWPASVSATEVSYLNGLTDTLINLLAAKESSTSNNIDPDRLAGDTTDDDLIDQNVIKGFAQTATGGYYDVLEGTGGGTNYRRVSVPDTLTADLNLQYPDSVPTGRQILSYPVPTAGLSVGSWINPHPPVCLVIPSTVDTDDYPIFKAPAALTIIAGSIHVYAVGGTNVVGGLDECTGTNGVCSSVTAVDADITGTAGSDVADDGSLTNPTIPSGSWVQWHTTSVSGTNTSLSVCFSYYLD